MGKRKTEVPVLQQRFFGVRDAARYLGVSVQYIYNGTSRKAKKPFPVPFKRIGGKVLFDLRDLERV
jgi:hypothetical protein